MCTRAVETPNNEFLGKLNGRHSAVDSSSGQKPKLHFSRLADNDTLLGLIRRTLLFLILAPCFRRNFDSYIDTISCFY